MATVKEVAEKLTAAGIEATRIDVVHGKGLSAAIKTAQKEVTTKEFEDSLLEAMRNFKGIYARKQAKREKIAELLGDMIYKQAYESTKKSLIELMHDLTDIQKDVSDIITRYDNLKKDHKLFANSTMMDLIIAATNRR